MDRCCLYKGFTDVNAALAVKVGPCYDPPMDFGSHKVDRQPNPPAAIPSLQFINLRSTNYSPRAERRLSSEDAVSLIMLNRVVPRVKEKFDSRTGEIAGNGHVLPLSLRTLYDKNAPQRRVNITSRGCRGLWFTVDRPCAPV